MKLLEDSFIKFVQKPKKIYKKLTTNLNKSLNVSMIKRRITFDIRRLADKFCNLPVRRILGLGRSFLILNFKFLIPPPHHTN